jgi:hypothetical protein
MPVATSNAGALAPPPDYAPQLGDLAVFQNSDTHKYGHVQMYDGTHWVSDWHQKGYSPYRQPATTPPGVIYRFPGK